MGVYIEDIPSGPCRCSDCGATWPDAHDVELGDGGDIYLTAGDPSPIGRCRRYVKWVDHEGGGGHWEEMDEDEDDWSDPKGQTCDGLIYMDRPVDRACLAVIDHEWKRGRPGAAQLQLWMELVGELAKIFAQPVGG